MIDRIVFANSISYPPDDGFTPNVIKFFDEIMLMYNIIGNLDIGSISVANDIKLTCFNMHFLSENQVDKFKSAIEGMNYNATIYGKQFNIELNKIGTDVSVVLRPLN